MKFKATGAGDPWSCRWSPVSCIVQRMSDWDIQKARTAYNIAGWSNGYFDINQLGHVEARPRPSSGQGIDLYAIARQLPDYHLSLPVLVRFTEILHDRIDSLLQGFDAARQRLAYQAPYTAIYPIKVNQQHSVVQAIVDHGDTRVGLEAGSKPELLAVLGIAQPGSVIVCNGYKDSEYIRLALIGQQLGQRIYIVIEKMSELELVLEQAAAIGIRPCLGLRVRLASIGAGNWQNTGGEKSKFGLSAGQVLQVVERLRQQDQLAALQMLHFHLGSQLVNLADIRRGMQECGRFYTELYQRQVPIDCIDVGGGLGVDYEGSHSLRPCSTNYTVQDYASTIVDELANVCTRHDLPQPRIFSESGRALTAHHAVLVTNIIDTDLVPDPRNIKPPEDDTASELQGLWKIWQQLDNSHAIQHGTKLWEETVRCFDEVQGRFSQGRIDLEQRAWAESIYHAISHKLQNVLRENSADQNEALQSINEKRADKYFGNFSLFQSLPDSWAIEQFFPVMPLHRLKEEPTRQAVLEDITCDSDGRIDNYVDQHGITTSLAVHDINPVEDYLLGIFLVGAYQEILGDMHNLFGDTDSVHVCLTESGGYELSKPLQGDTVDHVLRYVHFNPDELLELYRNKLGQTNLSEDQQAEYLEELGAGLHGYTYLEK